MGNKEYQLKYRRNKEKDGWRYFSIMVHPDCYMELKRFYLIWKSNNLEKLSTNKKK